VLDNMRLRTRLAWQPTVALRAGIARTWESIQNP